MRQEELPVIQKQERISPLSRGSSHVFFCSSLPNMCSTSIFPVSVDRRDIFLQKAMKYNNRFLHCSPDRQTPHRLDLGCLLTCGQTHKCKFVLIKAGM